MQCSQMCMRGMSQLQNIEYDCSAVGHLCKFCGTWEGYISVTMSKEAIKQAP